MARNRSNNCVRADHTQSFFLKDLKAQCLLLKRGQWESIMPELRGGRWLQSKMETGSIVLESMYVVDAFKKCCKTNDTKLKFKRTRELTDSLFNGFDKHEQSSITSDLKMDIELVIIHCCPNRTQTTGRMNHILFHRIYPNTDLL